ncbi:ribonuclease III [Anaerovorax sp. IOR16]|uniref:ribonuclease III n=1 Tax=Anaerovorax sp. IOR16 TaxID=2773458 RepID=UPI0019D0381D
MSEFDFSKIIGYTFKDLNILKNALTHSSYINESKQAYNANNERLEFLGDAILDAVISDYLYHRLSDVEEGQLTKLRSLVVCERSLMECATRLEIGTHLYLGKGEENSGGRNRTSILADAMEAVIGAVYLDGGWDVSVDFILRVLKDTIEDALAGKLYSDYKTELQERLQINGEVAIHYEVEKEEGPDHDKTFYVRLTANKKIIGNGQGRSKKEAEQHAAKAAIEKMGW